MALAALRPGGSDAAAYEAFMSALEVQGLTVVQVGNFYKIIKAQEAQQSPGKPGEGGERSYALMHGALKRAGSVAVLRFAVRETVHLAILSPGEDGYLVLSQLHGH